MTTPAILRDLVVLFAVALVVVLLLRKAGIPGIAAYIVAGMVAGPNALGLVPASHEVEALSEVGVVLLLFGIGLELSLDRLRRVWRPILAGGSLQVAITFTLTFGIARLFGADGADATVAGFVVAVSSTAIVLRGLEDRAELHAPHGRLSLGVLVFQDLCVVPMIVAIPLLTGAGGAGPALLALGKAVAVLGGVLLAARWAAPRLLGTVARTRQRDLFVLAVVFLCLGIASAVALAGISLALGAFLAGLVVAGSEYRHQALAELVPLREVFVSFFFVSVGMLIDPAVLLENLLPVLGLLSAVLAGKFAVVYLVGRLLRLPPRVSLLAGAALCQIGEFSFVLWREARSRGMLEGAAADSLFLAIVLSMLLAPLLLAAGPHLAAGLGRVRGLNRLLEVRTAADAPEEGEWRDHVIVAGYGYAGEELARALSEAGRPHVIVDLNAENVRRARKEGRPAFFGDVTSPEVLEAVGAHRAREIVLVLSDGAAAERAVRAARETAPGLFVFVRTRFASDVAAILAAGASEVVSMERESAAEVVRRVRGRLGEAGGGG